MSQPPLYSHRNGETEPPTLIEHIYWFDPLDYSHHGEAKGLVYIMPHEEDVGIGPYIDYRDGAFSVRVAITDLRGRWWGPVIPPWEQE